MKNKNVVIVFVIGMTFITIYLLKSIYNLSTDFSADIIENDYGIEVHNEEFVGETYDGKTVGTYNNPIIPKGFVPVDMDNAKWENVGQDYVNGMVIEDRTGLETHGSQFVWIPVKVSETEAFEEVFVREEYIEGERKKIEYNHYEAFPNQVKPCKLSEPIKTEVTEMYKSVEKNGGFYIARYEAGKIKEYPLIDGSEKPVSLPDIQVWNNIIWGGTLKDKASDGYVGDDTRDGAVKVARSMYLNEDVGAKSTLVYGVQWDAVMRFVENRFTDKNALVKNENRELRLTGVEAVNNIYDFFGNVSEYTMEASIYGRSIRGQNYEEYTMKKFYQHRTGTPPNYMFEKVGFRVALYIK